MSNTTENQNSTPETKLFADTNISMKSGRLTRDATILSEGKFAKVTIACNEQYLDADNEVKSKTNYFNALVSSNLTDAFETVKDLKKGDWIYLKGKDATQSFDTPEGYKKTETTMFAYKVTLKKQNGSDQDQNDQQPAVA